MKNHYTDDISIRTTKTSIEDAIDYVLSDLSVELSAYDDVIIKPNICNYMHASTGATTDFRIISTLIKKINELFSKKNIFIVESDSQDKLADVAFSLLGYTQIAEKYKNVELINLTKCNKTMKVFNGLIFSEFEYPNIFNGNPFFISVPKLKTFEGFYDIMTCALKNQFGCNPNPIKWIYHKHLAKTIYDLNKLFKPNLIIVDGIIAMEGRGPARGIPKRMDLIIGGKMPASVDVACAGIMGMPYKKVKHLKFALNKGDLGSDNLNIKGIEINTVKKNFLMPKITLTDRLLRI